MYTACEKCLTKYQLNLSSIKGPKAVYKCKKCGHLNRVSKPARGPGKDENLQPDGQHDTMVSSDVQAAKQKWGEQNGAIEDLKTIKPKISGLSIKTKITLVIVVLAVSAMSIVGFIASTRGGEALYTQAENHLVLITTQKAKEYNNIFARLQNEIEGVAVYANQTFARDNITQNLGFRILMPWTGEGYGNHEMTNTYNREILALQRIGVVLQGLVRKNPYLELGYMATQNNVMVLDNEDIVGVIEAETGYTPSKRPWYIDAVKAGKTIWTQPYIDVNTKKLVVTCATPVYRTDNQLIGVVGFDVLLDTIQKDIISIDIGYNGQAFLLGKTGNLLAKPGMSEKNTAWNQSVKTDNALETDNAQFKAIVKKMMAGESGLGMHAENGSEIIVSYAPLPAIDASVGIVVAKKDVMRSATDIQKLILAVWVVVVIISIFVGLMIGNTVTSPINNLTMTADQISQGKMDLKEITTKRKDEIGVLIEAFNRLVTSLRIVMSRSKR